MNRNKINARVALLAGVSAIALAAAAPPPARAQEADGGMIAGYYAVVEARYGFGAGDDTTYQENGAGTLTSEIGADSAFSGRIGFGLTGAGALEQWDLGLFYTGLRSKNDDFVRSVNNAYQVLGTYASYSYDEITVDIDMSYHVVDLEAGYDIGLGDTANVRAFGGLRFASFDQQIETLASYPPSTLTNREQRQVDYSGAGPRLGVTGAVPVAAANGLGVTGTMAVSMIFGTQKTSTRTVNDNLGSDITVESKESRRVTSLEAELGLTYDLGAVTDTSVVFELGYRYEGWLGVNNTASLPPTASGNTYGSNTAKQAFHGPYLRATMKF